MGRLDGVTNRGADVGRIVVEPDHRICEQRNNGHEAEQPTQHQTVNH